MLAYELAVTGMALLALTFLSLSYWPVRKWRDPVGYETDRIQRRERD